MPQGVRRMSIANTDMAKAWDGDEGAYWAEHDDRYSASSRAHATHLYAAAGIEAAARVLDIGCGCGESTREAARRASFGAATGVDLSSRMLARGRELAAAEGLTNVEFVHGDAQVHPFEQASYDVAMSRMGAMFFADPVAGFANIRAALRAGGRLALLAWRGLEHNEWIRILLTVLAAGRDLPAPPVGAPGPFGLADTNHVRRVLTEAGYADVAFAEVNERINFGTNADDAFPFVRGMGVTTSMLDGLDEKARKHALDTLHEALADHETDDGVVFSSSAWLITARDPR